MKKLIVVLGLAALAISAFAAPNLAYRVASLEATIKGDGFPAFKAALEKAGLAQGEFVSSEAIAREACKANEALLLPGAMKQMGNCLPAMMALYQWRPALSWSELQATARNPGLFLSDVPAVAASAAPTAPAQAQATAVQPAAQAASAPTPATAAELEALRQEQVALAAARDADRRTLEALNSEMTAVKRVGGGLSTKAVKKIAEEEARKVVTTELQKLEPRLVGYEKSAADLVPKDWFWWLLALAVLTVVAVGYLVGRFGGFKSEQDRQDRRIGEVSSSTSAAVNASSAAVNTANGLRDEVVAIRETADKAVGTANEAKQLAKDADALARRARQQAEYAAALAMKPDITVWSSGGQMEFLAKVKTLKEGETHTEKVTLTGGAVAEVKFTAKGGKLEVGGIALTESCELPGAAKAIFNGCLPHRDGSGAVVASHRFLKLA